MTDNFKFKAIAFDYGFTLYNILKKDESTIQKMRSVLAEYLKCEYKFSDSDLLVFFNHFTEIYKIRKANNVNHSLVELNTLDCIEKAFEKMSCKINKAEITSYVDRYHAHELDFIQPLGNSIAVIQMLFKKRIPLALVTNNPWHNIITLALERDNLLSCFDEIISSSNIGIRKPSPEIFNKLLHSWKRFSPSEILFVGDSLVNDVSGAKALGIKTALLKSIIADESDVTPKDFNFDKVRPDYLIKEIDAILNLI